LRPAIIQTFSPCGLKTICPKEEEIVLKIKDASGKLVATLKDEDSEPQLIEAEEGKIEDKKEEKEETEEKEGDQ
jgi:hypothetical protein